MSSTTTPIITDSLTLARLIDEKVSEAVAPLLRSVEELVKRFGGETVSSTEAAKILGVTKASIGIYVRNGKRVPGTSKIVKLPAQKFGKDYKIKRTDLVEFTAKFKGF